MGSPFFLFQVDLPKNKNKIWFNKRKGSSQVGMRKQISVCLSWCRMIETYGGQTIQILGSVKVCLVVNFRVPKLVEVCASWSKHSVISLLVLQLGFGDPAGRRGQQGCCPSKDFSNRSLFLKYFIIDLTLD